MSKKAATLAVIMALSVSPACSSIERGFVTRKGHYTDNLPDLQINDVQRFVQYQNEAMNQFVLLSGVEYDVVSVPQTPLLGRTTRNLSPESQRLLVPVDGEWRPVIDAGMHYVDVRCDRFLDALFWMNRIRETTSREIRFAGAASAAALTILSASQELIGLAPLGFGFLDQTVNNIGEGLLYSLHPTVVRTLVEEQQRAYRQDMQNQTYSSRALALQTIQGYAALCLPAAIEAEVNRAITDQRYQPIDYRPRNEPKPQGQPEDSPQDSPQPQEAVGPPEIEPTD